MTTWRISNSYWTGGKWIISWLITWNPITPEPSKLYYATTRTWKSSVTPRLSLCWKTSTGFVKTWWKWKKAILSTLENINWISTWPPCFTGRKRWLLSNQPKVSCSVVTSSERSEHLTVASLMTRLTWITWKRKSVATIPILLENTVNRLKPRWKNSVAFRSRWYVQPTDRSVVLTLPTSWPNTTNGASTTRTKESWSCSAPCTGTRRKWQTSSPVS